MIRAEVRVMLKTGVLDPQGQATRKALANLGFDDVDAVAEFANVFLHCFHGLRDPHARREFGVLNCKMSSSHLHLRVFHFLQSLRDQSQQLNF